MRLSRRAVVLGLILTSLALSYVYPVQVYLGQEAEIATLEAAQSAQQVRIKDLTESLSRWEDDEYIRAQARRRLYLVHPGEVLYIVGPGPTAPAGGQPGGDHGPWQRQLWSNIQTADNPP